MKSTLLYILLIAFSCVELTAQDENFYLKGSTNLLFLKRVYPIKDPLPDDNNKVGDLAPGIGLGFGLRNRIKNYGSLVFDLDFSFKNRDHYFYVGALYFRLDERLIMNTVSVSTSFEKEVYRRLFASIGLFGEYILDKNQNFSYQNLVYSPFNYGPKASIGYYNNSNWNMLLAFDFGIPKFVDHSRDHNSPLPKEFTNYLKFSTLQFSIRYYLY